MFKAIKSRKLLSRNWMIFKTRRQEQQQPERMMDLIVRSFDIPVRRVRKKTSHRKQEQSKRGLSIQALTIFCLRPHKLTGQRISMTLTATRNDHRNGCKDFIAQLYDRVVFTVKINEISSRLGVKTEDDSRFSSDKKKLRDFPFSDFRRNYGNQLPSQEWSLTSCVRCSHLNIVAKTFLWTWSRFERRKTTRIFMPKRSQLCLLLTHKNSHLEVYQISSPCFQASMVLRSAAGSPFNVLFFIPDPRSADIKIYDACETCF